MRCEQIGGTHPHSCGVLHCACCKSKTGCCCRRAVHGSNHLKSTNPLICPSVYRPSLPRCAPVCAGAVEVGGMMPPPATSSPPDATQDIMQCTYLLTAYHPHMLPAAWFLVSVQIYCSFIDNVMMSPPSITSLATTTHPPISPPSHHQIAKRGHLGLKMLRCRGME